MGATDLLSRPAPGGKDTLVLGGDGPEWTRDSQALGVGSVEACAAMETRSRPAPGGADSIDFTKEAKKTPVPELMARPSPGGSDSVDFGKSAEKTSVEELMSRPRVGGCATVVLGSDNASWARDSQAVGVGSAEAVASMDSVARPAPGGVDSIDFGGKPEATSKEQLLTRPPVGGKAMVVLGGDDSAWKTDSSALGVGSKDAVVHAEPRSQV